MDFSLRCCSLYLVINSLPCSQVFSEEQTAAGSHRGICNSCRISCFTVWKRSLKEKWNAKSVYVVGHATASLGKQSRPK